MKSAVEQGNQLPVKDYHLNLAYSLLDNDKEGARRWDGRVLFVNIKLIASTQAVASEPMSHVNRVINY